MKVKVLKEFLGVPVDSIGEVILPEGQKEPSRMSCEIKFDCKSEPVHVGYPLTSYYLVLPEA